MRPKLKLALMAAFAIAVGLCVLLSLAVPVLPSKAYSVTATLNGRAIEAELLRPLLIPDIFYVRVLEGPAPLYGGFRIDFSRQAVLVSGGVPKGWWDVSYVNPEQARSPGVRITSGKLDDRWQVKFSSKRVQFSNASLAVSLIRSP